MSAFLLLFPTYALASISTTSGNVLYVDSSNNVSPKLQGDYVSFNVTNDTGSAIADAWVTIGSFTGGLVSLAPNENGIAHLGAMSSGATKPVFFYLQVDCSSFSAGQCNVAAAQGFTVRLYSGPPTTNLLQSQAFSVTVSDTISSSNNTVNTVVVSSTSPTLGSIITVTVTGATGTIGGAKIFYASPETTVDFPATSFRLVSTSVTFSGANTGTFANQLLVPTSAFSSTATTSYSFVATYLVVGSTTTSTPVSPVAFISSGAQVKHTNTSSFTSLSPIGVTSNSLTLSKLVNSAAWPTGGTPTYTLRVTNSSPSSATLDDFVDTLPSSPSNVNYATGTSTFSGSAFSDPVISGNTLTWTSSFTIPANFSVDLTFQATVPNAAGSYTNSAVAHLNGTQIDTTTSTSDNSPATVSLSVGSPDLTVNKAHTGNFTQGQVGASYSITVSNAGSGPSLGSVAMVDTLPSGLTATALSGTGWSCTLGTLTCTRSDALNSLASYPAIALTVSVASNAASSLTNTATVSGGGETNTANDTSSDVTAVTQIAATTTSLSVSPSPSINAGTQVTLMATVTAGSTPVFPGVVDFCDASTSQCVGLALVGTAQLRSDGTATLKLTPGAGSYSLVAFFRGTPTDLVSSSTPQALMVAGIGGYVTSTTITATGSSASYSLTGTVAAFGKPAPTGTVSFIDTSNGNNVLGTPSLDSGTLAFASTLVPGLNSITGAPSGAVAADLNNDGKIDVVVATGSTNKVSIFIGNGDGSFQAEATADSAPAGSAVAVAVGDFNGDGKLDLAVLNSPASGPGSVSILIGNGDGTFQSQVAYETGSQPSALVVGDFNGDGNADIAVANEADNSVGILLGNGDGTFQVPVFYPVGAAPVGLVATDLKNGGILDLITVNHSGDNISVLMGNGDGTFAAQVPYSVGSAPAAIAVADFNGDGIVDVAVANQGDSTIGILLGNGDGTFQNQGTTATSASPNFVVTGDFDGDGIADLATSDSLSGAVSFFLGKGDGTFLFPLNASPSAIPTVLVVGDSNGDGLSDIVSANSGSSAVLSVLLSQHIESASVGGISFMGSATHSVEAGYSGDSAFTASQSSPIPLSGAGATSTTTTLTASPNPATFGQALLLTATVSPTPTGSPLGTVSFFDGTTLLGTVNVNSAGIATFSDSSLGVGSHTITAVYSGNSVFATSTSSPVTTMISLASPVSTTTTLGASLNPATAGQSVLFTAIVSPTPTGTPLGTVSLFDGASLLGTTNVNFSGVATFSDSGLSAGSHQVTAVYSGNTGFATSTSGPVTEVISPAGATPTTTALSAVPNPVVAGQAVSFAATISPVPTGPPLGIVTFFEGATQLGSVNVNALGIAVLSDSGLAVGSHSITAQYSGNSGFAGSTSNPVTELVSATSPAPTTTTLSVSPSPAIAGQPILLTATISPAPTGSPLGTVSFFDGSTLLGTANVSSSGIATATTSNLQVGSHALTAVYSGSSSFATSTSTPVTEAVALVSTTTALSATPNPAVVGQAVLLTAAISPSPSGASFGVVNFFDGANLVGSANVNAAGVAVFSTAALSVGSHILSATYSGNADFASSTSIPLTEIISVANPTSTITTLSGSPNPAVAGQSVTLTTTVSPTPAGSPLGTISFFDGTTLLGTANLSSLGVATFSTSTLSVGSHSLTAVYSGNTAFAASNSSPLALTVNNAPPVYTVAAPQTPFSVIPGGSVEITVDVAPTDNPFNSVVTMSATNLPPGATVSFMPPTVIPGSTGTITKMKIQTAGRSAKSVRLGIGATLAGCFVFLSLCLISGRSEDRQFLPARQTGLFLFLVVVLGLTACNGGFAGRPSQPQTFV